MEIKQILEELDNYIEMEQVYDENLNLISVPFDVYLKHKAFYDNNLSRVVRQKENKEYHKQLSTELKQTLKDLKKYGKLLGSTYGSNVNYYEDKINKLKARKEEILNLLNV